MKRGKKEKGIHIHLTNRWLYTLIATGIILFVGAGFFAASLLTPGVIPNPGHSINQTAPPSGCSAGQVLQWTGASNSDGGWACVGSSGNQTIAYSWVFNTYSSGTQCTNVNCPSGFKLVGCSGYIDGYGVTKYQTPVGAEPIGSPWFGSGSVNLPSGGYSTQSTGSGIFNSTGCQTCGYLQGTNALFVYAYCSK